MSDSHLRAKYGAAAYDAGLRLQPKTFVRRLAQCDSLDQHFTKLWLDFVVTVGKCNNGLFGLSASNSR